ncbi:MAG TPA: DMT family transporter [Burkholderiales bacterium]|nr:DMT family transporter [Burkholderiales bacterium]
MRSASPADRSQLAVGALFVSGLLWGLTWMPFRYFGTQGLNGVTFTLWSYGLVGCIAVPWMIWRARSWWPQRKTVALIALTGGGANVCFTSALMAGEVVRVMLLFYLAPVWGVFGGRIAFNEPITRLRLAAVAAAVMGAFLLLGGPAILDKPPTWIDALALASGMLYASQNIFALAADQTPLDVKTLAIYIGCFGIAGALFMLTRQASPAVTGTLILQLAAFAGIWMMAAMVLTVYGVSHLEAGRSAILLVFELVAAVVSAMWIGGERLAGFEWVGAALITSAALIEARSHSRN